MQIVLRVKFKWVEITLVAFWDFSEGKIRSDNFILVLVPVVKKHLY